MVTMLQGTTAQTKQQRRNEAMRRQQSSEFLSPLQVARLLGMGAWNLLLWRKKGFGPPFIRVTRHIIRYPKQEFDAWLASLPRN
jgi:predicted DNA-binding transcriptional regulator AlpA